MDIVSLQSSSVDPEGDTIQFTWYSDKEMGYSGMNQFGGDYLLVGCMKLPLYTTDDDLSHLGQNNRIKTTCVCREFGTNRFDVLAEF